MRLYDYQQRAVNETVAALHKNPILTAPTGSGKTTMGRAIVARLCRRTLWLAHRRELIHQAAEELAAFRPGIILSGVSASASAMIQVASVQTVRAREIPKDISLVVIDEAHHVASAGYQYICDAISCPRIGLTATPFRLDGRGMAPHFGHIVTAATTRELCAAGTLLEPVVFAAPTIGLHSAKKTGGDYNLSALEKLVMKNMLVADIIEMWQKHAPNKPTICFATTVHHSMTIVDDFNKAGIRAEHVDGKTPAIERAAILDRLASGETTVVSNVMILTEGFNLPSLGCLIIARPTASLCLHLQMLGRVMRTAPGKPRPVVLDHSGNHAMHGTALKAPVFSLDGMTKTQSDEPGMRTCNRCFVMYEGRTCPECGYEQEQGAGGTITHVNGELVPFIDEFEQREIYWYGLIDSGLPIKTSKYFYQKKFNEWPVLYGSRLVDTRRATLDEKAAVYADLHETALSRGYKTGWASWKYKDIFGCWPRGFVNQVRAGA